MTRALPPKARELIVHTWQSQANLAVFLLLMVVTVFVLPALDVEQAHLRLYGDVIYTFLLITGIAIAWGQRRLFATAAGIGGVTLVARWLAWVAPGPKIEMCDEVLSLVTMLVVGYVLLAQIFRKGPINGMRVQGAIAVYLLLGIAYAQGFLIASHVNPRAISGGPNHRVPRLDLLQLRDAEHSGVWRYCSGRPIQPFAGDSRSHQWSAVPGRPDRAPGRDARQRRHRARWPWRRIGSSRVCRCHERRGPSVGAQLRPVGGQM